MTKIMIIPYSKASLNSFTNNLEILSQFLNRFKDAESKVERNLSGWISGERLHKYDLLGVAFENSGHYASCNHDDEDRLREDQIKPLLNLRESISDVRIFGLYDIENAVALAKKEGLIAYRFPQEDFQKVARWIRDIIYQQ